MTTPVSVNLVVKWNTFMAAWSVDVYDQSQNLIIGSVPLVTGANLLEQFAYLELGGKLNVQTDGDPEAVPTFENLGSQSHLYFIADA